MVYCPSPQTITVSDGTTTLTFREQARIIYQPYVYQQQFQQRTGKRTFLQSGPFVKGQIFPFEFYLAWADKETVQGWSNSGTILTVVDNITDSEFTAKVDQPQYDPRYFFEVTAHPDSGQTGNHQDTTTNLYLEQMIRYQGQTDFPFLLEP